MDSLKPSWCQNSLSNRMNELLRLKASQLTWHLKHQEGISFILILVWTSLIWQECVMVILIKIIVLLMTIKFLIIITHLRSIMMCDRGEQQWGWAEKLLHQNEWRHYIIIWTRVLNIELQDEEEYDPNDSSATVFSSSSYVTPSENTGYNLRANRKRYYSHCFGFTSTIFEEEMMVKPTRGYQLALRWIQSAGTAFSFYSTFVEEDPTLELNSEIR